MTTDKDVDIKLNPDLDWDEARAMLTNYERAHLPGFLTDEAAVALYKCLRDDIPWSVVFNSGEKSYDLDAAQVDSIPEIDRLKLSEGLSAQASEAFQFVFHNYRADELTKDDASRHLLIHKYYDFVNGEEFKKFIRYISDIEDIDYVDAQATKYVHGHFLSKHDDLNQEKGRRLAMICNLTPKWNADWGGLLTFYDEHGHIAEGFQPTFNALNLLYVGQEHSVTYVTPFAGARDTQSLAGSESMTSY